MSGYDDDPFGDNPFGDPVTTTTSTSTYTSTSTASLSYTASLKSENDKKLEEIMNQVLASVSADSDGLYSGTELRPILLKSNISMKILKEIWSLVDEKKIGSLSKEDLKKALQLIALAQENKPLSLAALESSKGLIPKFNFDDVEDKDTSNPYSTPQTTSSPSLSSTGSTRSPYVASNKASIHKSHPTISYHELLNRETILMEVVPEKGGGIFKYTNYTVKSRHHISEVIRRYSDFDWLRDILLKKYPFRIIPKLPPKKIAGTEDETFLEIRRRGLIRFLEFVGRHPILGTDTTLAYFLTEKDTTAFANFKESKKASSFSEEFYSSPFAQTAKNEYPPEAEDILRAFGEKLPMIANHFNNLVDIVERIIKRIQSDALDFVKLGAAVEGVIENEFPSEWVASNKTHKGIKDKFQLLGKVYSEQAQKGLEVTIESLKHHQNLITGLQQLIVRRSQTTQNEHQALVKRIQVNKEKLSSMTAKGKVGKQIESVIQEIEKNEQEEVVLKQKDEFATYCLWEEVIHFNQNKALISVTLQEFCRNEMISADQALGVWNFLQPMLEDLPVSGF